MNQQFERGGVSPRPRKPPSFTRIRNICRSKSLSCGIALAWALSCACCSGARAPNPKTKPPSIFIVVLDACRPDKIGCYGFKRPTSPNIDALAADADAVVFRRHYAQGAWTKPSTASLFSGLFLRQHGVTLSHEFSPGRNGTPTARTDVLPATIQSLAERLAGFGFGTFAVLRNEHLAAAYGFAQGFATYDALGSGSGDPAHEDPELVERFLDLVPRSGIPSFGYLHVLGCHFPFPDSTRDPAYMRNHGFLYDEKSRRGLGVDFTDAAIRRAILEKRLELTTDDVRFLHLIYEARLAWVDGHVVAPLLRGLRAIGAYDDSLIILTADHGEELYDHGEYGHGQAAWEELIHVPLIVKFPRGQKPRALQNEVNELTNTIDLMPSLMEIAGHPTGRDVPGVPILKGIFPGYAFSEARQLADWALMMGHYKLIETLEGPLLFDLSSDPGEHYNLASDQSDRIRAMRAFFRANIEKLAVEPVAAPTIETELEPEMIERLRGLGYVD